MSPTIVTKDGKPFMVVGSPGGSRIITITLEAILNVIDFGMDISQAVNAPRIHHQWQPDKIYLEPYTPLARYDPGIDRDGPYADDGSGPPQWGQCRWYSLSVAKASPLSRRAAAHATMA